MKSESDILSQEEFNGRLRGMLPLEERAKFEVFEKSHSALHDKVAELEKSLSDSEKYIENKMLPKIAELEKEINALRRVVIDRESDFSKLESEKEKQIAEFEKAMQWERDRANDNIMVVEEFRHKIADLEKQLSFESGLARNSISCRDKQIAELEKQLADKKQKRVDTEDEAWNKACNEARRINRSGNVVRIDDDKGVFKVSIGGLDEKRFPYAVPREPQPDDLYHVWDNESEKAHGYLRRFKRIKKTGAFVDSHGMYWNNNKPTGYRWDTETESIQPIED